MGAENVMRLVQTFLVCILYLRLKESGFMLTARPHTESVMFDQSYYPVRDP